jgi:hypothetical protein
VAARTPSRLITGVTPLGLEHMGTLRADLHPDLSCQFIRKVYRLNRQSAGAGGQCCWRWLATPCPKSRSSRCGTNCASGDGDRAGAALCSVLHRGSP